MGQAGFGLDALLRRPDHLASCARHPDRRRELALSTRPTHVEDEPAGDQLGEFGAVVLFENREGEVDARGDTGRRPHVVRAADEQGVGVDPHGRIPLGEELAHRPVRSRASAVEQPGLGGEEGAVADADDAPCPTRRVADPVDEVGVLGGPVDARAARQHQSVDRFGGVGQRVGDELQADAGVDGLSVLRHQSQVVGDGRPLVTQRDRCGGEDVGRSRHVECLHPGEAENQHRSCHVLIVSRRRLRRPGHTSHT
ncbi:hypothetical protein GOAMI_22_00940 [Gordonia amicalis NBRC 100051 = JCM 11271]|nr:hypothetical protein GOAMI_22_00940 [Gordonia amicalis NBRC 100051 = JCM 11271]